MKIILFFAFSMFLAFQAQAGDPEKGNNIISSVKKHCEIPTSMAAYTQANFERYVLQVIDPELKMLSTAFLQGFSTFSSNNLRLGYCVVVFMGLKNDPGWEKGFDFYGKASAHGVLPQVMFVGFDENDQVLLKAAEDVN